MRLLMVVGGGDGGGGHLLNFMAVREIQCKRFLIDSSSVYLTWKTLLCLNCVEDVSMYRDFVGRVCDLLMSTVIHKEANLIADIVPWK